MKKLTTALVLMVTLLPTLPGMLGKIRYPAYYTLNLPAPPDPPAAESIRTSIASTGIPVSRIICGKGRSCTEVRRRKSVLRISPLGGGPRGYSVTGAVIDHLRAGGQFSTVSMYDGRPNNDLRFQRQVGKAGRNRITRPGSRSTSQCLPKSPASRPVRRSGATLFPKLERCLNALYPA